MRIVACLAAAAVAITGTTIGVVQYMASSSSAHADETTISQDLSRDGWDSNEPLLSPATVSGSDFGQIFATKVNGQVFGQPLVVGKSVLVATEDDYVYSINRNSGAVNWSRQLGAPYATSAEGCSRPTVQPYVGVTSTPVYDPGTGTIYVSGMTSGPPGDHSHLSTATPEIDLFALSASTGVIKWQKPISGIPTNNVNGSTRAFDPSKELNRAGLLLLNGSVYIAFAGLCSATTGYWGYVAGVNTTSRAVTLWTDEADTPGTQGGIWQGGGGLMTDGKSIYVATGNGSWPASGALGNSQPAHLGMSVVRLDINSTTGALSAGDFFSQGNADTSSTADHDLGSGGPITLPFGTSTYPRLIATAGKEAHVFLLSQASLGGRSATETGSTAVFTGDDSLVNNPPGTLGHGLWGHMAAMAGVGPAGEAMNYIYYAGTGWGSTAPMQVLQFDGTNPAAPVLANIGQTTQIFGFSSGSPVITSNGTAASSAVVWDVHANDKTGAGGELDAFSAIPDSNHVLQQIWSAPIGFASEFSVPATDAGQVYVGTRNDGSTAACPINFESSQYVSTDSVCVGAVYGFGVKAAQLSASMTTVNLGNVALGQTASAAVTVTNTGDVPVTITKFAAPDVPFGTPAPLAVNQVVPVGGAVSLPITFSPQAKGMITGKYAITGTDGFSAPRTLTITAGGVGAAPASGVALPTPGGGWKLNGAAAMTGTALRLNPATASQAGSAVFYQPVASNGLTATFTAQLSGGSGGDGLTFALISPTDTTSALGQGGGMLGFGGMHGIAVVLGTRKDTGFPSANFVGIATGTAGSGASAHLVLRASSTAVPNLRTGTHVIGVTITGTKVTVSVNGKAYVSATVSVPATVLPAFTAASGAATDVHSVSAVTVTPTSGTLPAPGGGWSFNGTAAMSGSDTGLTPLASYKSGAVVYPRAVNTSAFKATFDVQLSGGTGAEGMTLALLSPTSPVTSVGANGQGLGFAGLSGLAVVLGTDQVPGAPSANFVGISTGATSGTLNFVATAALPASLRAGTHVVTVFLRNGTLTVSIDGSVVLTKTVSVSATARVAFTGSTRNLTDLHIVRDGALSSVGWGS
jgi:hypothetical protein